ncbi:DUF1707 SHOCT-like domain-containing protein [Micromonospora sonneratiae]|uniref:DUF1707 domain-containing protein n=1 Tax=Micromonospora sonneratiae TaxID=1184706 RepID=A0ABW3YIZ4_9ACTN
MRTLSIVDVQMRASDDDRQRAIADLQRHTEVGRLSLDEFSDRVGAVYSARTLAELAAVSRDLPTTPAPVGADSGPRDRRDLLVVFAVAAVTLVVLGIVLAVAR